MLKELFFAACYSFGSLLFLLLILSGVAQLFLGNAEKDNYGN